MATVLITGAARGIGFATSLVLARAGHHVIATMRDPATGTALARITSEESLPIDIAPLDVDADDSVRQGIAAVLDAHGSIDVLVNNAGIVRRGTVEELPLAEFRATMETNYFGMIRCIKAVLPGMRERGTGCIVNISSVSGRLASSPLGPYAASKFAVEALSEVLAQEVRPLGIRVAVVQPGSTDTAMLRSLTIDRGISTYPTERHLAGYFANALETATDPVEVGETVRKIIEGSGEQFRFPVGADARASLAMRAAMADEDWVRSGS